MLTLNTNLIAKVGDANVDYTELSGVVGTDPKLKDIGSIISTILPYIFYGAGIILLFLIISGGFSLMTSGGDPKKTQMAQGKITSGIIGFVVIFAAYWITLLVYKILGVEVPFSLF